MRLSKSASWDSVSLLPRSPGAGEQKAPRSGLSEPTSGWKGAVPAPQRWQRSCRVESPDDKGQVTSRIVARGRTLRTVPDSRDCRVAPPASRCRLAPARRRRVALPPVLEDAGPRLLGRAAASLPSPSPHPAFESAARAASPWTSGRPVDTLAPGVIKDHLTLGPSGPDLRVLLRGLDHPAAQVAPGSSSVLG